MMVKRIGRFFPTPDASSEIGVFLGKLLLIYL